MIAVNHTSGTTGRPKGIIYPNRGAYLNAISVALEFQPSADSWYLWTLPIFHRNATGADRPGGEAKGPQQ